jgi:hypothetical protein
MSALHAVRNIALAAGRRLASAHKPFVRAMRRRARDAEHRGLAAEAAAVDDEIARVGRSGGTILVGPWLAEVGYEVLYWIPFLRWFQDSFGIAPERLVVVSRGGIQPAYGELAGTYVDLFDLMTPAELAARNAARQSAEEGGGQKQSSAGSLDRDVLDAVASRVGAASVATLHPSLMFRLFREVWHGNLPMDLLRTRTRYRLTQGPGPAAFPDLPQEYVAVKVYGGPALTASDATQRAVRAVVAAAARQTPLVVLDTDFGIDEHRDFDLSAIPNVTTLGSRLDVRTNLGTQVEVIARARAFLGTCGGLAWLAPFVGVPTVALLDSERFLGPHLATMRHARHAASAAAFSTLDVTALAQVGVEAALTEALARGREAAQPR